LEALITYFSAVGFGEAEIHQLAGSFQQIHLKRGEFFVQEGRVSRYMGFVTAGFLQYYVVVEGDEKTTYAIGENNFVVSLVSFLREVPAQESIRAVMDTTLWVIDHGQLRSLLAEMPCFKDFYIGILESQICCIDESRLDAIMLSAQQRYEKMLGKEPQLVLQIPLQYLASILGVTPRHLSRIRGKIR
jgi:CRP/FNR family transcriptional regulator, anaerobic regulatory protein